MLKEVGASGQISLGKRYAGQLFDMATQPDGRIVLTPMKAVPAVVPDPRLAAEEPAPDGWRPPGGYAQPNAWSLRNRDALEAYAQRIDADGTAAQQLEAWLTAQVQEPDPAPAPDADGPGRGPDPAAKR
jgi:hypothetical protein